MESFGYSYTAFGLHIVANQSIPGLRRIGGVQHQAIHVSFGCQHPNAASTHWVEERRFLAHWANGTPYTRLTTALSEDRQWLRLVYGDGVTLMLATNGDVLCITWDAVAKRLTQVYAAAYVPGVGLAYLLALRGHTVLHASGAVVNGQAVLFVGDSGAGKSTMAYAFARRGHLVLVDDIAPLYTGEDGRLWSRPGYGKLRMRPRSAKLEVDARGSADVFSRADGDDSYTLDLDAAGYTYATESVPLGAVYALSAEGDHPTIQRVTSAQAAALLGNNLFTIRAAVPRIRVNAFNTLARAAETIPVGILRRPADLARLDEVVDFVLDDLARLPRP